MQDNKNYFPGIFGAIGILLCFVMAQAFIFYIFYGASVVFRSGDPRTAIVTAITTGIFFSLYNQFSGISTRKIFNPSGETVPKALLLVLIPVLITTVASFWWLGHLANYISSFFPEDRDSLDMLDEMMKGGLFTFFAICVVAPLSEEMIFRGVILRGFLNHYSPINAVLASSVLFGAVHCNVYQAPGAFIIGCFFGWIYYLSRSLWPSIFAHAVFNFTVYMAFLNDQSSSQDIKNADSESLIYILSILVTFMGLFFCYKLLRFRNR